MRFFIALELPEESKEELRNVQQKVKEIEPILRLTDNTKLHLTVAFIGEQPDDFKDKFLEIIQTAAFEIPPFEITPAYLDGFPTMHHLRILWVGIKGDIDKLQIIQERIKDGLRSLNLHVDERRYTPHIAIAKAHNLVITAEQENKFQQLMLGVFQPIQVNSIKLFESIPNQGFHTHNKLGEIELVN